MKDFGYKHAILWDLDGVLVDTGEHHYAAWQRTFDELGIPYTREMFWQTFGMNNAGILELMYGKKLPAEQEQQVSERKEILFRDGIRGQAQLLPGVQQALEHFSAWGFKQAIASSAPPKNIEVLVDELRIGPYFDAIVSAYVIPGKPDPAVFLLATQQVGERPERCIVIEDSVHGVEAAKRAGMKCIAVTTSNPAEALFKADLVLDNLAGLEKGMLADLIK